MQKLCLAHLSIYPLTEFNSFLGLSTLTNMMDVEYRCSEIAHQESRDEWKQAWAQVEQLIEKADAFLVTDSMVLSENRLAERLHERLKGGARILFQPDVNGLDTSNRFLERYGLMGTNTRILSVASDSHEVRIARDHDCYLDYHLLDGVDEVVFGDVNAVQYSGEAFPVLLATDENWAIDRKAEVRSVWNRRQLACIAKWQGTSGGAVVALGGNLFSDSFRRWTDLSLICGLQQNARFTANLIRYAMKLESSEITSGQLCERTEKNLVDFVLFVLKQEIGEADWWAKAVPLPLRQKCAERQAEEANRKFPEEAYLDLLDLKEIIERNWPLFNLHFRKLGRPQGKQKSLDWLMSMYDLRRLRDHRLKMHVAPYSLNEGEALSLREADSMALQLVKNVSDAVH